jgi:hypothetical protein
MAYNQKRRKRYNKEYQKRNLIRCKYHNKPVFDTDSCSEIKLKGEANTAQECKHCRNAY